MSKKGTFINDYVRKTALKSTLGPQLLYQYLCYRQKNALLCPRKRVIKTNRRAYKSITLPLVKCILDQLTGLKQVFIRSEVA